MSKFTVIDGTPGPIRHKNELITQVYWRMRETERAGLDATFMRLRWEEIMSGRKVQFEADAKRVK